MFDNVYQYPLWIFLAVFKGGLVEEGTRVFGLTRFENVFGGPGLVIAAVLGSIVFGVGHLYQGVDSAIGTGVQGLLFILIYQRIHRGESRTELVVRQAVELGQERSYRFEPLNLIAMVFHPFDQLAADSPIRPRVGRVPVHREDAPER